MFDAIQSAKVFAYPKMSAGDMATKSWPSSSPTGGSSYQSMTGRNHEGKRPRPSGAPHGRIHRDE
jgi:hypothetical protein